MRCPQGLDTPVGERGYSLSGGQRQRLALARAIVAQPAVLLLDDCTSALDAETEARIQQALDRHLPGRTCVIVSHKVSSVRRCDLIVVLEAGRIIEQGTHRCSSCRATATTPPPTPSKRAPWSWLRERVSLDRPAKRTEFHNASRLIETNETTKG